MVPIHTEEEMVMEGEEAPTWFHQPFPVPMDVNWQEEGDEWLHHVWVALSE
jgi:hypothetical protein